jgi:hypothetical protein
MMIGGEKPVVGRLDPIFATLAPGKGDIEPTPGREKLGASTAEQGYLHCGPNGAGHFVKMVHNGIEYGLMAAYAEGLNVLHSANVGKQTHTIDAETTPLRDPEHYQYDLNLPDITELWRRGSVIASWLLDLTANALAKDPGLAGFAGRVSDSGEGRWTIKAAIDEGVPAHVLSAAFGDALRVRRPRRETGRLAPTAKLPALRLPRYFTQLPNACAVDSSIGKKNSTRISSSVTSRGVPSVAMVVNSRSEVPSRRKWIGNTGLWLSCGVVGSASAETSGNASSRLSRSAVSGIPSA